MAAFQVSPYGRFWVSPKGRTRVLQTARQARVAGKGNRAFFNRSGKSVNLLGPDVERIQFFDPDS